MAIDDVVSDFDAQIANTASVSPQPASGDEWLLTQFFIEAPSWTLLSHTDAGVTQIGNWGGDTAAVANLALAGLHEIRFHITNTEYIRFNNTNGSTKNGGFSTIKTKD